MSTTPEDIPESGDAGETVSVTINYLSGELALGPKQVSGSTTILELKELFDEGVEKDLVHEGKLVKDDNVVSMFGVQDVTLTTCAVPEHHMRARRAARLLGSVQDCHVNELAAIAMPVDMIRLSYLGCYLAVAATYGEDINAEPWCGMDSVSQFGVAGLPFCAEEQGLTYVVSKQSWELLHRPLLAWSDFTKFGYHSKVFELLGSIDHFQLEQALQSGGRAVSELRQLLDMSFYTSVNARKAAFAAEVLVAWLEESVKPLLG